MAKTPGIEPASAEYLATLTDIVKQMAKTQDGLLKELELQGQRIRDLESRIQQNDASTAAERVQTVADSSTAVQAGSSKATQSSFDSGGIKIHDDPAPSPASRRISDTFVSGSVSSAGAVSTELSKSGRPTDVSKFSMHPVANSQSASSVVPASVQTCISARSGSQGSNTSNEQLLPTPENSHARKGKTPMYKLVQSASMSSVDSAIVIPRDTPPKSAKRRLNRAKQAQAPVVVQPARTRFGRTLRPPERFDSSSSKTLLPSAREDLLDGALRKDCDAKRKRDIVLDEFLGAPPRKKAKQRPKRIAEVCITISSRLRAEMASARRLRDIDPDYLDEAAEVEALLEGVVNEVQTPQAHTDKATKALPRDKTSDTDAMESEDLEYRPESSVHESSPIYSSDIADVFDGELTDLTESIDNEDARSTLSDMYAEPDRHQYIQEDDLVVSATRQHSESSYHPTPGSEVEGGPSRTRDADPAEDRRTSPVSYERLQNPFAQQLSTHQVALDPPPPPSEIKPAHPPYFFEEEQTERKRLVVPIHGAQRRLEGFLAHTVTLDPSIRDVCTTRAFFSSIFGGNTRALYPTISPRKRARTGYGDFLFPTPKMNPHTPRTQGQPGLLCRATDVIPWGDRPMKVFVTAGDGMWCYMGDYVTVPSESLSSDEWNSLPTKTRDTWVRGLLRSTKRLLVQLRARIALRHRLSREPTATEIEDLMEQNCDTWNPTEAQISQAYNVGYERIRIWVLNCVGYDEAFQRNLVAHYSRPVPESVEGEERHERRGGRARGNAGEDEGDRPKKRSMSPTKPTVLAAGDIRSSPKKRGRPPKHQPAAETLRDPASKHTRPPSGAQTLPSPPASPPTEQTGEHKPGGAVRLR